MCPFVLLVAPPLTFPSLSASSDARHTQQHVRHHTHTARARRRAAARAAAHIALCTATAQRCARGRMRCAVRIPRRFMSPPLTPLCRSRVCVPLLSRLCGRAFNSLTASLQVRTTAAAAAAAAPLTVARIHALLRPLRSPCPRRHCVALCCVPSCSAWILSSRCRAHSAHRPRPRAPPVSHGHSALG